MFVVFSTSLNPDSRSRILARAAGEALRKASVPTELIDLAEFPVPFCDASDCYADPNVQRCTSAIRAARAILIATPVYNYGVSASAKNLIELTGQAWTGKVVGFLAAAGGPCSYMSILGLANSLMLDFRTIVIPQFVFATEETFADERIVDPDICRRTSALAAEAIRLGNALADFSKSSGTTKDVS